MSLAVCVGRILTAAALAAPAALAAQDGPPPPTGAWFGSGVAYQRGCYNQFARHCLGGPALGLQVGQALNATVRLGVGLTGLLSWSEVEDQLDVAGSLTGVLRVRPLRRTGLALTAGLGIGSILLTPDRLGLAAEGGLAYDFPISAHVSLAPYLDVLHIADRYRPTTYWQLGLAVTID